MVCRLSAALRLCFVIVGGDEYHYDETDAAADFARNEFLDLTRPLVMQVWRGKFRLVFVVFGRDIDLKLLYSKAFYLKQVHQPRYLPRTAVLFGPVYLEVSFPDFCFC